MINVFQLNIYSYKDLIFHGRLKRELPDSREVNPAVVECQLVEGAMLKTIFYLRI